MTRAEAAAILARALLGAEEAAKLPGGQVMATDVYEDHWSAKYIAFCLDKGIMATFGGIFYPNGEVISTDINLTALKALIGNR